MSARTGSNIQAMQVDLPQNEEKEGPSVAERKDEEGAVQQVSSQQGQNRQRGTRNTYTYRMPQYKQLPPIKSLKEAPARFELIMFGGSSDARRLEFVNKRLNELDVNMFKYNHHKQSMSFFEQYQIEIAHNDLLRKIIFEQLQLSVLLL